MKLFRCGWVFLEGSGVLLVQAEVRNKSRLTLTVFMISPGMIIRTQTDAAPLNAPHLCVVVVFPTLYPSRVVLLTFKMIARCEGREGDHVLARFSARALVCLSVSKISIKLQDGF